MKRNCTRNGKKITIVVISVFCFAVIFSFLLNSVAIPIVRKKNFLTKLNSLELGEYYTFGSYEQDDNISNGKEDIEWIVLDKQDNKILLISKYGLDCQQYSTDTIAVTWKNCTLRQWLNNDFFNDAFSDEEKKIISISKVTADKNPFFNTNPGNITHDKVFLLSITEADKYFNSNNSERTCTPTKYAITHGAAFNKDNGNCWWWLRSPGDSRSRAANVNYVGGINANGYLFLYGSGTVRPALWIEF